MEILFANRTTNGTGDDINISTQEIPGGFLNRTIYITGTLDGATFTLQVSSNGTDWVSVPDADAILPSPANVSIRAKQARGVLAGGGGAMDVTVVLR